MNLSDNALCLCINTEDQKTVLVSLKKGEDVLEIMKEENEFGSQALLPLIDRILDKNNFEYKDLSEIEVKTGPGSFTGIRVGVSIANALGYSLNIPVNSKKIETDLVY
jgi:tRNA threonylcarbamoyladenosine biosynthesis protein TsaB